MMIWCILCSFFALASGMDVEFSYEKACYSVGDTVNMNARYTGSGTVTAVQWYYSKQNSQNLLVVASNCIAGTPIDTGYPLVSRMSYICDLAAKEFKLTLSSVKEEEFNEAWGATFSLSADASPGVVQKEMNLCTKPPANITIPTTTSSNTTTTPPSGTTQHPKTLSLTVIIVISCVVSVLLFAIPFIICVYLRYKSNQSKQKENPQSYTQDHSSKEIKDNFQIHEGSDMKESKRVTNASTNRSYAYEEDTTKKNEKL